MKNILNLFKDDEIELISYGSLYGNITVRNPYLQAIFMRIKRVEAIGSGLRRVNSYYEKLGLNFEIKALPSTFIVTLPRITLNTQNIQNTDTDIDLIIKYIEKNGSITRKIAETLIKKEKTTTSILLNRLVADNILIKIGNGPSTRYEKNK